MKVKQIIFITILNIHLISAQNTFYDVDILGTIDLSDISYQAKTTIKKTGGDWCQNLKYTLSTPAVTHDAILHNTLYKFNDVVSTSNSNVIINQVFILQDQYNNDYYVIEAQILSAYTIDSFQILIDYDLETISNLQLFQPIDIFPLTNIPSNISNTYLAQTNLVDYNDASIQSRANILAQGKTTELEVVEACAKWIKANVNYVAEVSDKASDVLQNGGDCDGLSHLMVAFLRYLGIPARVSTGRSFKIEKKYPIWGENYATFSQGATGTGYAVGHGFYEVYYPTKFSFLAGDPAQHTVHFYHVSTIKEGNGLDSDWNKNISNLSVKGTVGLSETAPSGLTVNRRAPYVTASISNLSNNTSYEQHDFFYGPSTNFEYLFNSSDIDIMTGPFDHVAITDPPPGFPHFSQNSTVFSSGDQVNFYTEFDSYDGMTWSTLWDWKIELYHTGGTYTYAESTTIDYGDCSYWQSTTSSSLPCYNWARDFDDNIHGKVIATAHVNDGWLVEGEWIIGINDHVYIQNQIFTSTETIQGGIIHVGSNVDPTQSQGPVIIENGANVTFDYCNEIIIEGDFEVETGGIFETE